MERKLAETEAKLVESQRSLRALMSHLPGMAYRCQDDRDRTMTFVSEGCTELTGHEPSGLVGSNKVTYMQLIHVDDRETVLNGIRSAVAEKRPFNLTYRIRAAAGEERWVREKGSGVYSRQAELQAIEGFITDITELKRAEEAWQKDHDEMGSRVEVRTAGPVKADPQLQEAMQQLQSSQEQLLQSAKLAAIGQLVSGVSHELKNPLGAIMLSADLLQEQVEDAEAKQSIQILSMAADRAIRIVDNLLSFSRKHEPKKGYFSIHEGLNRVLELRAYDLNLDNIKVTLDFTPDLPRTMADPHQLEQVFLNVVCNAEQAMKEAHGRGELIVRTKKVDDTICITFADDGPGIPPATLRRIFDPFFTTKEVGRGTGLGLSICYGIIQEHGGQISVESHEGQGSTFVIELPIVEEAVGCQD